MANAMALISDNYKRICKLYAKVAIKTPENQTREYLLAYSNELRKEKIYDL